MNLYELFQAQVGAMAAIAAVAMGAFLAAAYGPLLLGWSRPGRAAARTRGSGLRTDLGYLLLGPINEALSRACRTLGIAVCAIVLGKSVGPELLRGFGPIIEQPRWIVVAEVLVVADFAFYWTHRLAHTVPFLWRFHAIHHSTRHVHWISALRAHPTEAYAHLFNVIPLLVLGFPVDALGMLLPVISVYALAIHCDVDISLRPLRYLLNTPAYHRWHHARDVRHGGVNFAGFFPIWDLIFGTYHLPDHRPLETGIDDPDMPEDFLAQLAYPFRKQRKRSAAPLPPTHVVITGGTHGIGHGLASAFLREGCRVTIAGRTKDGVERALRDLRHEGTDDLVAGTVADVGRPGDVDALWRFARARAPVDIWINNAGVSLPSRSLWENDPEALARLIATNVAGVALGSRVAMRGMVEEGRGKIYNVEGFGALGHKLHGSAAYGASKRAVRYLTDAIALEARRSGVIVATVDPGAVQTRMLDEAFGERLPFAWLVPLIRAVTQPVEAVAPGLSRAMLSNRRNGAHLRAVGVARLAILLVTGPFRRQPEVGSWIARL